MAMQSPPGQSIRDFSTWQPVLRLLRAAKAGKAGVGPVRVAGRIGRGSWSLALPHRMPPPGRASQIEDMQEEMDAVRRVQTAMAAAGVDDVSFSATIEPDGAAVLRLLGPSPAVEPGIGTPHPGALVLVEGSLPEPWRRLPDPTPGAKPAPTADPELLERTLRERIPDAVGATEEEIAAAEARLGVRLPEELKVLYRVTRGRWEDWGDDYDTAVGVFDAVRCELSSVDDLYAAEASTRHWSWQFAAKEAVDTRPDDSVQGVVGSPGWIVFGENGGGDRLAVDLTPGPCGHTGQIVLIGHEESVGAELLADSLTDWVLDREAHPRRDRGEEPPLVAHVNHVSIRSVREAAHPGLEVLSVGVWDGAPFSLAPVIGLPRLRTLAAYAGTLADPREIGGLTGLEFLELGPEDWRVLLDAGAVPRSLSAAAITAYGDHDPLPVVAVANEILALWDRPQIIQTVLGGDLGPLV
ncbi:SMI1/KNR4 family protein [Streptomyces sp. NPDC057682]|uniref:SMI1/KNR4 family protein n=1 Tax=Streptomyces sp. NPDC057682 TaxID=3346210 RepID=UPI0036A11276